MPNPPTPTPTRSLACYFWRKNLGRSQERPQPAQGLPAWDFLSHDEDGPGGDDSWRRAGGGDLGDRAGHTEQDCHLLTRRQNLRPPQNCYLMPGLPFQLECSEQPSWGPPGPGGDPTGDSGSQAPTELLTPEPKEATSRRLQAAWSREQEKLSVVPTPNRFPAGQSPPELPG